jgi:hypothetical protein
MLRPALLISTVLLAGCAGYAADYLRAERSIIAPQIARYGVPEEQRQCVTGKLTEGLSVWQLRQLERIARLVPASQFGGTALTPQNLLLVAGHVGDRRVQPQVQAALEECQVALAPAAAEEAPAEAPAEGAAGEAPAPGAPRPLWLNLGAALSGQSIAVNAASIVEEGTARQAWFRLTNPGETTASPNTYLLRVDCASRTLNSMAFRRHGPDGEVAEERDFRPDGEGVTPVAGGTVMEIAFLALCT